MPSDELQRFEFPRALFRAVQSALHLKRRILCHLLGCKLFKLHLCADSTRTRFRQYLMGFLLIFPDSAVERPAHEVVKIRIDSSWNQGGQPDCWTLPSEPSSGHYLPHFLDQENGSRTNREPC